MPTPVPSRFTLFEFTEDELYAASRFNSLQLMLFQSLIAKAALKKINLKFDASDPVVFAQQEAELTSEIEAYEHLLMLATEMEAPAKENADKPADVNNLTS